MVNGVIICDVPDHYLDNRVFTEEVQRNSFGEWFWVILKQYAEERGWEIMTADIFLARYEQHYRGKLCYLISYMVTARTKTLLNLSVVPLLIYSLESPNVAIRFYTCINSITGRYRHAILFRGVAESLREPERVHVLYWPNTLTGISSSADWSERQLLCMIASNKSRHNVVGTMKWLLITRKQIGRWLMKFNNSFADVKDLYSTRLKAIEFLSGVPGFILFGKGWDKQQSLEKSVYERIQRLNPRTIDDKIAVMTGFKFCLCFENCIHPGYLTEKIFDCFFAGAVPVYLGAPDVNDFIPADCFIDFRKFSDFNSLINFLNKMSRDEYRNYRDAAVRFVSSDSFKKFTAGHFAQVVIRIIEETPN